ncbi:MAG: hypothetical protein E6Q67_00455 [Roseateles sp.]|nr:MAG: hypothetical protein E6Q67_00455 [Roseateles sp.]
MAMTPPSPLLQGLQGLALRLHQASSAQDWAAVGAADAALADLLRGLRPEGLATAERGALNNLRLLHTQVRADCERELEALRSTLNQMQERRTAWSAYAESQDWSPETP